MPIQSAAYSGDMVILERGLSPQDAQLRASFLRSVGIAADAGDVNIVQAHGLLALAVGGACVRVPQTSAAEAAELLEAYRRGDFALKDDFDGGEPPA